MEVWKDVIGYEGLYEVSNLGRVRSVDRIIQTKNGIDWCLKGKVLKPAFSTKKYFLVTLCKGGKQKTMYVHKLVATAFVKNHNGKPEINHINGNKTDNRAENLEWASRLENMQHAFESGLVNKSIGENHRSNKLSELDIMFIRENYKPYDKEFGMNALARKFGVYSGTISKIVHRETWKWF